MSINLPVQSLQQLSSSGSQQTDVRSELSAGRTLEASVREVTPDPQRPNLFRIKVEVQRQLMELLTSQPLNTGSQISLSQDASGKLQLALTNQSQPSTQNQASSQTAAKTASQSPTLQLQLPSQGQSNDSLSRLLPVDQPQTARVVPNTPTAQPNATTGNSASGSATPPSTPQTPQTQPARTQPEQVVSDRQQQSPAPSQRSTAATTPEPAPRNSTPQPSTTNEAGRAPQTTQERAPAASGETAARPTPQPTNQSANQRGNAPAPAPAQTAASSSAPATPTPTPTPTASNGSTAAEQTPAKAPNPQTTPSAQPSRNTTAAVQTNQSVPPGQTTTTQPSSPATGSVQVTLSVNGQQIELLSPRPLQPGLEVQLTRSSDNQIQLQLAPQRNDNGAQLKLQEGLQQILRDNLPQQLPAGDALNQMRQISGTTRQGGDALGQVVKSMLSLFSVPPKGDAKATQQVMQNHLQSSGLISRPQTSASNTQRELPPLQQQVGKLTLLAEQLPPQARDQMLTLVKGLQARSASHQATSLQNWQEMPDGSIERQYRLDLPIRLDRDRLEDSEIRIQQHKKPDQEGRFVSQWSIQLHFDREDLGSVDAHVSLQQEWQLSARFWAEREDTTQLIREQLDSFQQQLGNSGFEVEALQVQRGSPPRDTRAPINHSLVDLHT